MQKKTNSKLNKKTKLFIFSLIIITVIAIVSVTFGYAARGWDIEEKNRIIALDAYLDDGKFRGVEVHEYQCWNKNLEEMGISKNFSCSSPGFYTNAMIFINTENSTPYKMKRTLFHEYGHYVWYNVFTDNDREEYKNIYLSANTYVSYYALEAGVHEDWAETYEAYMIGFEDIPPRRMQFIMNMKMQYPEVYS